MTTRNQKLLLILFSIIVSQKTFAEVNLLTGSYLLKLNTPAGKLSYDSRNNSLGGPGFGWLWNSERNNSRCQLLVKDFLLTSIVCSEKNKPTKTWSFHYDSEKNLTQYSQDDKRQEKITYYTNDSVHKVATDTCIYEFKFQNGDRKNYQATETTTKCLNQQHQREITIFALKKNNTQAYVPRLIKKIGGSLALQNNP